MSEPQASRVPPPPEFWLMMAAVSIISIEIYLLYLIVLHGV